MKIVIGADIVPTESNMKCFEEGRINELLSEDLYNKLKAADFRIFNLETPLTDEETPIKKCGPNLIASINSIVGLKKIGSNLFTLANNHIMDQGIQGLETTINVLKSNGIDYIGVGENLEKVKHSYVIENNNKKIGIYACAEHEFSIADENNPGANPFDPYESMDHIAELKKRCDYVVVLYHGGKEHYRYPSPLLQKICRKMVDKGADLVIAQHTHCIGCEEKYNNGTIVYGQGNFLFDAANNEYWNTSLLIELSIELHKVKITYVPLCKSGKGVRLANCDEELEILDAFYKRSKNIKNPQFVKYKYREFALSMKKTYINKLCGVNIFFRIADKICGHKLRRRIKESRLLAIQNYIECESHRELVLCALKMDDKDYM